MKTFEGALRREAERIRRDSTRVAAVRSSKPVLEELLRDIRRAVEEMPSCGRRDQLEGIVASFNTALNDPKTGDNTQAEADAFRETWGL